MLEFIILAPITIPAISAIEPAPQNPLPMVKAHSSSQVQHGAYPGNIAAYTGPGSCK